MKKKMFGTMLLSVLILSVGCSASVKKEESLKDTTSTTQSTSTSAEEKGIKEIENKILSSRNTEIPASIVLPEDITQEMPLVILAHGFMGSRDEAGGFTDVAKELADNGIASVRIDFPGCNDSDEDTLAFSMKNNSDDVLSAIDFMKENYKISADKIGMLGYSMGGRVTSLVSAEVDLNTIVLWAPLISKTWEGTLEGENLQGKITEAEEKGHSTIEFFGNDIPVSLDLLQDLNNDTSVKNIANFKGNALLITGENDDIVLPSVTNNVAENLSGAAKFESISLPKVGHGMGIYEKNKEAQDKLVESSTAFFVDNLK